MTDDQASPYICGQQVGSKGAAFVGRESILKKIWEFLNHPEHNGIWLYGYARIGKSSILKRLELELSKDSTCLPIFYSFDDSTNISKNYVVSKLIEKINPKLQSNTKTFEELFNNDKLSDKKIIFLFDEFQDSILNDNSSQNEETFSDYLRNSLLKLDCKHFNFVIASRKYNHDRITRFFTAFPYKEPVSLFDENDTEKLICLSEEYGMRWSKPAIKMVWGETQGHPYLIQCLCDRIWNNQKNKLENFIVQEKNVKQEINPNDIGKISGIAAIWTDLSLSEQVVLLAMAKAMPPDIQVNQVTKDDVEKVLNNYKSLQQIKLEREIPPLTESPYIIQDGNTYRFKIKLLARWLKKNHENQHKLEEIANKVSSLYSGNKAANGHYDTGYAYRFEGRFEEAIESFKMAIKEAEIHLGASKELIEIQYQQRKIEDALKEIKYLFEKEKVYGENLVKLLEINDLSNDKKIKFWQGILNIYPDCPLPACLEQRGNNAFQAGRLEEALKFYQQANLPNKIVQVWEKQGDEAYQKGDWENALAAYHKAKLSNKVALVEEAKHGINMVPIPENGKEILSLIRISRSPITISQYKKFRESKGFSEDIRDNQDRTDDEFIINLRYLDSDCGEFYPDIHHYLQWLTDEYQTEYRLPTKEEWLYAKENGYIETVSDLYEWTSSVFNGNKETLELVSVTFENDWCYKDVLKDKATFRIVKEIK